MSMRWSRNVSAESPNSISIVTVADIRGAARRLDGVADHTPLLESSALSRRLGGRVLFKAECLQSVGSFKIRGAHNMISQLPPDVHGHGVVAFSSGNHAQAVAAVAAHFKIPAAIVMPKDAPIAKIEGTRARGAEIVLYDRLTEDREAIGRRLAEERGATLVPPFDDPRIIAGQGTVGLEIAFDCEKLGVVPNLVLVPCSGGGLVAGIATAVKAFWPDIAVIACEPERYDDTARSLATGHLVANTTTTPSICDALMVNTPGKFTFAINRMLLSGAVAVSDSWVMAAMKTAKTELNLITEPGGAIGLAALLSHRVTLDGRTAVVVLSGSNVDRRLFDEALIAADPT
jgi:threonine dehydratase